MTLKIFFLGHSLVYRVLLESQGRYFLYSFNL